MASFSLFGNVMSMESVQLVGANRDALLLSFKDAKVVLRGCRALTCLSSEAKMDSDSEIFYFLPSCL